MRSFTLSRYYSRLFKVYFQEKTETESSLSFMGRVCTFVMNIAYTFRYVRTIHIYTCSNSMELHQNVKGLGNIL